jgi:hypothetical protein
MPLPLPEPGWCPPPYPARLGPLTAHRGESVPVCMHGEKRAQYPLPPLAPNAIGAISKGGFPLTGGEMRVSQYLRPQIRKTPDGHWTVSCFLCHWTVYRMEWQRALAVATWHAKSMRHSDMKNLRKRLDNDMAGMHKGEPHP